jgi:hypothetical protein
VIHTRFSRGKINIGGHQPWIKHPSTLKGKIGVMSMSELIPWRTNWQEALEEAKKVNRPLALEFYMEG